MLSIKAKTNERIRAAVKIQSLFRSFVVRKIVYITRRRFQECASAIAQLVLPQISSADKKASYDFGRYSMVLIISENDRFMTLSFACCSCSAMSWPFSFYNGSEAAEATFTCESKDSSQVVDGPQVTQSVVSQQMDFATLDSLREEEAWLEKAILERLQVICYISCGIHCIIATC